MLKHFDLLRIATNIPGLAMLDKKGWGDVCGKIKSLVQFMSDFYNLQHGRKQEGDHAAVTRAEKQKQAHATLEGETARKILRSANWV